MVSPDDFRRIKAKCASPGCMELCDMVAQLAERVQQLEAKHGSEHPVHKHKGGGRTIAEEA